MSATEQTTPAAAAPAMDMPRIRSVTSPSLSNEEKDGSASPEDSGRGSSDGDGGMGVSNTGIGLGEGKNSGVPTSIPSRSVSGSVLVDPTLSTVIMVGCAALPETDVDSPGSVSP